MTHLREDVSDANPYPDRTGFKNFSWTLEAIADWEDAWNVLWRLGIKWEWQNSDRYARRYGDKFNLFAVHNDAQRLDMALPLPGIEVISTMENWLLGAHIDNSLATEALNLIRKWRKKHVG